MTPRLPVFATLLALVALGARVSAQTGSLTPFVPVEGRIDGAPQSWSFSGTIGQPVSLVVESLSGDLDPVLEVRRPAGEVMIANDDYNYPDSRDSLLEAITLPDLGTFTATVSAFGSTSGEYRLTLLPGYSREERQDTFDNGQNWTALLESTTLEHSDDSLTLSLPDSESLALAVDDDARPLTDFYAQVRVTGATGSNWAAGMIIRQQVGGYYLYLVNARGEWRFGIQRPDGFRVIRDWTRHPSIRTGETSFTLAVMAMGPGFDLLYNNSVLGRESDVTLDGAGQVGLAVSRAGGASPVSVTFDDLQVTVPAELDGEPVIPQDLIVSDPRWMVQELTRRRLIPANGQLVLNLAESYAEFSRPGVTVVPLASNVTFTNLAMGASVFVRTADGQPGGCGLTFRSTAPDNYTLAYLDGEGGYGVSKREGETFSEGLFVQRPDWNSGVSHHLLIIANGPTVRYYIDGHYAGTIEIPVVTGGIGNAVVNFSSIYTSCRFLNTWLWRWE